MPFIGDSQSLKCGKQVSCSVVDIGLAGRHSRWPYPGQCTLKRGIYGKCTKIVIISWSYKINKKYENISKWYIWGPKYLNLGAQIWETINKVELNAIFGRPIVPIWAPKLIINIKNKGIRVSFGCPNMSIWAPKSLINVGNESVRMSLGAQICRFGRPNSV